MRLIIIILFLSSNLYAQTDFNTFTMMGKEFDISVSDNKGETTFWIAIFPKDNRSLEFFIEEEDLSKFKSFLTDVGDKLVEWESVAKANDVKELDKYSKKLSFKETNAVWVVRKDYLFDFHVTLKPRFAVRTDEEGTTYSMVVESDELTSRDNQFMKDDGGMFVFENIVEIQNLISKLDAEKARSILNAPKAEDLFQD